MPRQVDRVAFERQAARAVLLFFAGLFGLAGAIGAAAAFLTH